MHVNSVRVQNGALVHTIVLFLRSSSGNPNHTLHINRTAANRAWAVGYILSNIASVCSTVRDLRLHLHLHSHTRPPHYISCDPEPMTQNKTRCEAMRRDAMSITLVQPQPCSVHLLCSLLTRLQDHTIVLPEYPSRLKTICPVPDYRYRGVLCREKQTPPPPPPQSNGSHTITRPCHILQSPPPHRLSDIKYFYEHLRQPQQPPSHSLARSLRPQ